MTATISERFLAKLREVKEETLEAFLHVQDESGLVRIQSKYSTIEQLRDYYLEILADSESEEDLELFEEIN